MTIGRWLLPLGLGCLAVLVFSHVAERLRIFHGMGWGQPDSPGHYLDLVSAVLGCALVTAGIMISFIRRQPK